MTVLLALVLTAFGSEPQAVVGQPLRTTTLSLSSEVQQALLAEDWDTAADLLEGRPSEPSKHADWAFLRSWALVRADRAAEGIPLMALLDGSVAPKSYVDVVRAELWLAAGNQESALEALGRVPVSAVVYPRAVLARASVLVERGDPQAASDLYRTLIERDDPAEGTPEALLGLAALTPDPVERQALLRRVWWAYPRSEWSIEATRAMEEGAPGPTWQEVARRAEQLMALKAWDAVLVETGRVVGQLGESREIEACKLLYARGRSFYKKNQLTSAINGFGDASQRCVGLPGGYGAKALYITGTAWFRKGNWDAAASTFLKLPELYPEHSMADDGYTQAGIALQEKGDVTAAREVWTRGLDRFPQGDTVPEASFRLAFTLYLDGEPEAARTISKRLAKLPLEVDSVHADAGRYWDARWALYPDVKAPSTAREGGLKEAVEIWRSLCQERPHSFYALLAYARLAEVAPEVASALAETERAPPDLGRPWIVRLSTLEDPNFRNGVSLARVGLIGAALEEWSEAGTSDLTGDEMAWVTELRIANGDWLRAHDRMRSWMRTHPAGTLGSREAAVLRVAYPDRYWTHVQRAAKGDGYDPRLFHALVREESNFNRHVRSHAGALGLSQLMPATAKQTAGWLGMQVSLAQLSDPDTNLEIGAHYLDRVLGSLQGSPYLALAGYNAGSGRVRGWLEEWGSVPTDEFVERIPFRETRGYVKRVMGTWQTYRYAFDDGPAYADLSRYNHAARPD